MTGVVKQALPPVLMQKAGLEIKGARSRLPQADFAEALGIGRQAAKNRSGDVKTAGSDPVTAWPGLAAKLGSALEGAHHSPVEPAVPTARLNEEPGDRSGGDDLSDPPVGADRPEERVAPQPNDLPPTTMSAEAIVLPARQDPSPPKTPRPVAAQDVEAGRVISDIEVQTTPAGVASDNPPAETNASSTIPSVGTQKAVSFAPLRAGERTEPQQPQLATPPHPTVSVAEEGRSSVADGLPEAAEPVRAAARVTVVAQQNVPAPMASTALVLVESIAGNSLLGTPPAATTPNAIHASATHASAQSLKIQLHPAELGMVTATLRFAGEQLSIELRVENHEAYRRLTGDSDTIVGSLRDLGYDIEKVTVVQSSVANSSTLRSDSAATMHSSASRSDDPSNSSMSNGGNAGSGENEPRSGGNHGQGTQRNPATRVENSDSGLYI